MEQELKAAIRQYSQVRSGTLEIACNITAAQAAFKPGPKIWSVGENLDHLLLTEKSYRVPELLRLIELAGAGKRTSLDLTLKEMNASIGPIPRDVIPLFEMPLRMMHYVHSGMPSAKRHDPVPVIPAINPNISDPEKKDIGALLRAELVSSLEETKALFAGEMPARLTEMTVTHPILGSNNVVKIFQLMGAHEERHHGQMRTVAWRTRNYRRADSGEI